MLLITNNITFLLLTPFPVNFAESIKVHHNVLTIIFILRCASIHQIISSNNLKWFCNTFHNKNAILKLKRCIKSNYYQQCIVSNATVISR